MSLSKEKTEVSSSTAEKDTTEVCSGEKIVENPQDNYNYNCNNYLLLQKISEIMQVHAHLGFKISELNSIYLTISGTNQFPMILPPLRMPSMIGNPMFPMYIPSNTIGVPQPQPQPQSPLPPPSQEE